MRKIMVLQHVGWELLGTLDPLLKKKDFRIRYVNFARTPDVVPSLDKYSGLIILGGPMSANDTKKFPHLKTEMKLIEQALKQDLPLLGVCLGAQLMAKALGAKIKKMPTKEIGWYPVELSKYGQKDKVLSPLAKSKRVFHWHGDTFSIPSGTKHLASSHLCENQAFKVSDKAYGFQFHLEVDEKMIGRWLGVKEHKKEIAELKGLVQPKMVLQDTEIYLPQNLKISNQIFSNLLGNFPAKEKKIYLGSR